MSPESHTVHDGHRTVDNVVDCPTMSEELCRFVSGRRRYSRRQYTTHNIVAFSDIGLCFTFSIVCVCSLLWTSLSSYICRSLRSATTCMHHLGLEVASSPLSTLQCKAGVFTGRLVSISNITGTVCINNPPSPKMVSHPFL